MELFVDLHIHSCLSPCGDLLMTPNNIVGMAYLKGLDVIAVCDHNAMGNVAAVETVGKTMGVAVLPGMELTTREEAHMLAYFPDLEAALPFAGAVRTHLPDIPNNAQFFGRQVFMDDEDEETGEEPRLLISALTLSFEECARLIHEYGGICVPAHINRGSNGALNTLGFLPENVDYDALEVSGEAPSLPAAFDSLPRLRSSDAHYLENISEKKFRLTAREKSARGF